MKKTIELLPITLLILTGCSTNELTDITPVPESKVIITASIEQEANTRVTLNENRELLWHSGDAITLFDDGGNTKTYTLTKESEGKTSGSFEGDALQGTLVGAAHPATANPVLDGNKLTMTLPSTITYGNVGVPMYAQGADASNLKFKQLAGLLKLEIVNMRSGITGIRVKADKPISGTFVVEDVTAKGAIVTSTATDSDSKQLEITFPSATTSISDNVFYIPLPAQSYETIEISLCTENGASVLTTYENKTVERAMMYSSSFIFPNLTGTWLCTEYDEDGKIHDQSTFVFNSDNTCTTTHYLMTPGEDYNVEGSWFTEPKTEDSANIRLERSSKDGRFDYILSTTGNVNDISSPTKIEGSLAEYTAGPTTPRQVFFKFVMNRENP